MSVRPSTWRDGGFALVLAGDTIDPAYLPSFDLLRPPAPAIGGSRALVFNINFSYGDASPLFLHRVPAGKRLLPAWLIVLEAFDGIGAALQIGTTIAPGEVLPAALNSAALALSYQFSPTNVYSVDTDLFLTIAPGAGASRGAGQVVLQIDS